MDTLLIGGIVRYSKNFELDEVLVDNKILETFFTDDKGKLIDNNKFKVAKYPSFSYPFPYANENPRTSSFTEVALKHYLTQNNITYEWIHISDILKDNFNEELVKKAPIISISTTWVHEEEILEELVKKLRKLNSEAKLIIGGVFASRYPEVIEKIQGIDYLLLKDGDDTFPELVKAIIEGSSTDDIPNLYQNKNGNIIQNIDPDYAVQLDKLPCPEWKSAEIIRNNNIAYEASRGCAFNCRFCDYRRYVSSFRYKSARKIADDMKDYNRQGFKKLFFVDSDFLYPVERTKEFCKIVIDEKIDIAWSAMGRPTDIQDDEYAALLKAAGCKIILLGMESADDNILKYMNKGIKKQQMDRCLELLKKHGIFSFCSFMVGFPGETPETLKKTVDYVKTFPMDYVNFQPTQLRTDRMLNDTFLTENFGLRVDDNGQWVHNSMTEQQAFDATISSIKECIRESDAICSGTAFFSFFTMTNLILSNDIDIEEYKKVAKIYERGVLEYVEQYDVDRKKAEQIKKDTWEQIMNSGYIKYIG